MKKIKLMMMALLMCLGLQSFGQENFVGYDTSLLRNTQLVMKSPTSTYNCGYSNFYKDVKCKKTYSECSYGLTDSNALIGNTFTIVDICVELSVGTSGNYFGKDVIVLQLKSEKIKQLYFKYNPKYEYEWPFLITSGLKIDSNYYNKFITSSYDKFTGDTTYSTIEEGGIRYIKVKNKGTVIYYLSVYSNTGSSIYTGKGVSLILSNGQIISFPSEEVDYSYIGSNFYSKCFIRLSEENIQLLKLNGIKYYKLYIIEGSPKKYDRVKMTFNSLTIK